MPSDLPIVRDTLSRFNALLTEKTAREPDKISKAKELILSDTELSIDYRLLRANTEILKKDWHTMDTSASYSIALLVLFEHEIKDISSPHIENLFIYLMKNESPLANEVMQVIERRENFSIKQVPLEKLKELSARNIIKVLQLCEKKGDIEGIEWVLANVMKFSDNNIKHIMANNTDMPGGIVSRLIAFKKDSNPLSLLNELAAKDPAKAQQKIVEILSSPTGNLLLRTLDELAAKHPAEAQQKIAEILSSPDGNILLKNISMYKDLLHCLLTHPELENFVRSENFDWKSIIGASSRSENPQDCINFFIAMDNKLENSPLTENDSKLYTGLKKMFLTRNDKKQFYIGDVNQYVEGLSKNMNAEGEGRKKLESIISKTIEFNDITSFRSILSNPSLNFTGEDIRSILNSCLCQKNKKAFVHLLLRSKAFDKFCYDGRIDDLIIAFAPLNKDSLRNYEYISVLFNYACEKMDLDILSRLSDSKNRDLFNSLSPGKTPEQFELLRKLPLSRFKDTISVIPLHFVYILLGRFGYEGMHKDYLDCIMERLNPTLQNYTNLIWHYKKNSQAVLYFSMKIQDPETRQKILNHMIDLAKTVSKTTPE